MGGAREFNLLIIKNITMLLTECHFEFRSKLFVENDGYRGHHKKDLLWQIEKIE